MQPLNAEDRAFMAAEERERGAVKKFGHNDRYAETPSDENPLTAKRCPCDNPLTYRNEDGELRCLCGRAV